MKSISSHDSSILAFLAQRPTLSQDMLKGLVEKIEDERARSAAMEILDPGGEKRSPKARAVADELSTWAAAQGDDQSG